jgi:branched-chain amino acid transport system ATP-binding protein
MIELVNLYKRFGAVQVLRGVSYRFAASGTYAIMGSNGSGKTSLLNLVFGFYEPDSGDIFWGSDARTRVTSWSPTRRARLGLGYALQQPRGFPELTVEENIVLSSLNPNGVSLFSRAWRRPLLRGVNEELEALLELGHLADCRRQSVRDLPFGKRKILDILCLLARRCRVLLLDEPFAGVSSADTDTILHLINPELQKDSPRLCIIVSHEAALVKEVAGEILLMQGGEIVLAGETQEILHGETFRQALLA